jgi:hypothetical protein
VAQLMVSLPRVNLGSLDATPTAKLEGQR